MTDERVDSTFGHYELRSVLGRGGMGVVYEAYDHVHERVVALKLLPQDLARDDGYRDRFRREARTAGRLGEPHIIPIHDFGEIDGTLYIDMRLVRGRDLRALLRDQGRMTPERALDLLSQVGAALDAAHADGLVHRDVKPENIMVTSGGFAYLADFGIAARIDDRRLTEVGSAVGSFRYMAPERFSDAPVTAASDIYSLGCVLHECLTGSPPFNQREVSSLIRAHLTDPPPRLSTGEGAGMPGPAAELQPVLFRALAKDPGRRYSSAGQMMHDARTALARGTGASADNSSEPTQTARTASAPVAAPPARPTEPMRREARPAPPPTSGNSNRALWAVAVAVLVIALASGGWLLAQSFGGSSNTAASTNGTNTPTTTTSTEQPGTQQTDDTPATEQTPPGTVTITATPTAQDSEQESPDSSTATEDLHGPTVAPSDRWTYQGWSDNSARCHATDRAVLIAGGGDIHLVVCEIASGESGRFYYLGQQTGTGRIEIPSSPDATINGSGSDWVMTNKGTAYTITQGNLTITRPDGTTQIDRTLDTFETP